MNGEIIRIESVSKSYTEGETVHKVLDNINLTINRGEKIILLGRSGSGKSTLMNLISGIDKPDTGNIIINDINITGLSEKDRTLFRRKNIGFVFQFFNLIPSLNIVENVLLPLDLNDKDPDKMMNHALELLNAVGLKHRSLSYPDVLSGGEQQRVAIARALSHDPEIILADEPTGNLDYETGNRVMELLSMLIEEQNKTLIMATHSRELTVLGDKKFYLKDGSLSLINGETL